MKIVIDAFGGDNAPNAIIDGTLKALKKFDFDAILTGDENVIKQYLSDKKYNESRLSIVHAPEIITNDDVATEAIRTKKTSSLVVAFDILKNNEDCRAIVSAGSTGAVLSGGFLKLGRIKGVSRPALAPLLPTKTGKNVLLIDCGANVDCTPTNLCHFAIMGSAYYKTMFNVENPKVALLSNGTEDSKGNSLIKETFPLMQKLPINFVGNMEARDFMAGDIDVVVCDGFNGNILLKASEGAVSFAMNAIKDAYKSSLLSMIGALFSKRSLGKVKKKLDYNKYGGSPFLGCKKTIIKSHGSSKAETICSAIEQALKLENNNVNQKITEQLKDISEISIEENND